MLYYIGNIASILLSINGVETFKTVNHSMVHLYLYDTVQQLYFNKKNNVCGRPTWVVSELFKGGRLCLCPWGQVHTQLSEGAGS